MPKRLADPRRRDYDFRIREVLKGKRDPEVVKRLEELYKDWNLGDFVGLKHPAPKLEIRK